MTGDNIRNLINPIEDQITPQVLWLNLNHIFYDQIAPLAL
jgi:dihydroorotase